jgi:hypothetical protein
MSPICTGQELLHNSSGPLSAEKRAAPAMVPAERQLLKFPTRAFFAVRLAMAIAITRFPGNET